MARRGVLCIQDYMTKNFCYGCGNLNERGLGLKSFYNPETSSAMAEWKAEDYHCAGPPQFINGGIISTLIDCHGICLALADAQTRKGEPLGEEGRMSSLWYVTGSLEVQYLRPTHLFSPVELYGEIKEIEGKKTSVDVECRSEGKVAAKGRVVAFNVPSSWFSGSKL